MSKAQNFVLARHQNMTACKMFSARRLDYDRCQMKSYPVAIGDERFHERQRSAGRALAIKILRFRGYHYKRGIRAPVHVALFRHPPWVYVAPSNVACVNDRVDVGITVPDVWSRVWSALHYEFFKCDMVKRTIYRQLDSSYITFTNIFMHQ